MTNPIYRTAAWRKASRACLVRDGYSCQIRMRGCKRVARTSDHIVELEDGGAPYDLSNLQAACRSCNTAKRNRSLARRAKRSVLQRW